MPLLFEPRAMRSIVDSSNLLPLLVHVLLHGVDRIIYRDRLSLVGTFAHFQCFVAVVCRLHRDGPIVLRHIPFLSALALAGLVGTSF